MLETIIAFIVALAAIIISLLYRRNGVTGAYDSVSQSSQRQLYHGSRIKLTQIDPKQSSVTTVPAVFATPNYTDAVIFSAGWTDYDFAMWGDGKHRYLEEQYPGAFAKLNVTGYIHHVDGNFRPLGSGIDGEYICNSSVIPISIDEINVLEYLKSSDVIMNDYETYVRRRKEAPTISVTGNILCHIVCGDMHDSSVCAVLDKMKISYVRVGDKRLDREIVEPCVIVGDPVLGSHRYVMACAHIFLRKFTDIIVSDYRENPKTSLSEYLRCIFGTTNLYHDYLWLDIKQIEQNIEKLYQPQMKIKLASAPITHISGPAGVGKTTLVNRLKAAGINALDIDNITDEIPNALLAYDRIAKEIENGMTIFAGISLDMSVLSTTRYCINVDPAEVYKRLTIRTIESICSHSDDIKNILTGSTVDELNKEFDEISAKYQIRFPGFMHPHRIINDDIRIRYQTHVLMQYQLLSADEIASKLGA